jgi:conserved oligomeric Golgi complex subunit 1
MVGFGRTHTYQETIHAAISLFLLDSMSLSDTLGVLLSQRTKSVQAFFSTGKQSGNSAKGQNHTALLEANGTDSKRGRRSVLREVKRALCEAIDLLVGTMHTIRLIYSPEGSKPSSIESLLIEIQTDGQNSVVSTAKVLGKLPSASLLDLYLPPSIKSYAPYIDTTGTSTHLTGATVSSKLEKWFESNLNTLSSKVEHWVDTISNARDVDDVRSAALTVPSLHQLSTTEWAMMTTCVESACSRRIVEIWRLAFQSLHEEFATSLSKSLELIKSSEPVSKAGMIPSH